MNPTEASQSQSIFLEGYVSFNKNIRTSYGYRPSLAAAIVFPILFAVSFTIHFYWILRLRRITSALFVAATFVECIGWGGRMWSSLCPYNIYPFAIQLVAFTITPSFVLLGGLLVLRLFMASHSKHLKLLSANVCFFILSALIASSMAIQLVGAVATVQNLKTSGKPGMGVSIFLAGNVLQTYTILIIALFLLLHAIQKVHRNPLVEIGELPVLFATSLSTIALLVRCIYRFTTDIQGLDGHVYQHQGYFIGFDATMVFVAIGIYNVFDPAVFLGPQLHHMSLGTTINRRSMGMIPTITHGGTRFEIITPQSSRWI